MHFEKDFIDFLVVNGIDAESWESLKKNDVEKAAQIVDLFSDVVFEQVLRKVSYLEKADEAVLQFVHCSEEQMELIALKRTSKNINLLKTPFDQLRLDDIEIIRGSKGYQDLREIDLFGMIMKGYHPSKGESWNVLNQKLSTE